MLVLSLAFALPAVARADHCDVTMDIYSYVAGTQMPVNYTPAACEFDKGHEVADARLLWPGTDAIRVSYFMDAGTETLSGFLEGLGFEQEPMTLMKTGGLFGSETYSSPVMPLPAGALVAGCVTATIVFDNQDTASTSYHTLGGHCTDFGA